MISIAKYCVCTVDIFLLTSKPSVDITTFVHALWVKVSSVHAQSHTWEVKISSCV